MIIGISISYISCVITFDDLMLSESKTVSQIAQYNNVMNVIPNEKTNFVFDFSEFECVGSISNSLITNSIACTTTQKSLHQHPRSW